MEGITTYGQISDKIGVQGVQRLLSVFLPQVLTQRWAQTDEAKTRSGNTVKWRRYHNFVVDSAGIAENTTPNPTQLQKTDFFAVLQKFVIWTEITEECVTFNEDNILDIAIQRISDGLAQKIELFTIDILKAGTNVIYANSVAGRTSVTTTISLTELQLATRVFNRNDQQPITKMIPPSTSVSTAGVRPGFVAMCHTDLIPDMENIRGFKKVVEYGSPGSGLDSEVGEAGQVRFFCTRNFTPWLQAGAATTAYLTNTAAGTGNCDVYPILVVAKDAYAVVRLTGRKSVDLKVRQPNGIPDSIDPTASKGSVAGKIWYTAARTCEEGICRIEVACTSTPAA